MGIPGTWKKAVIKGMLGMTFFLLFVPQLSYKFYLCANNPSWTFNGQNKPRLSPERTVGRSIAYEHCRPLSLDKRYCLAQFSGLLPMHIPSVHHHGGEPVYGVCSAAAPADLSGRVCTLRGPPARPSFG